MKRAAPTAAADDTSHYAVSAFTNELIDDVARDHYSLRAWRTLLSRSWTRSLDDIRISPARMRSVYWWIAIVAAVGTAIILLTLRVQSPDRALTALAFWLPWYMAAVFFLITHIGMVDDENGVPRQSLLLPNVLSFSRLSLAPLVIWPCLQIPVVPAAGPVFALFLIALTGSDLLDGWVARRQKLCTRMGRMLDVLADLAFLTFLAIGLYLAGTIPGPLLLLLIIRYPLLLIAVLAMYFMRGPAPLRPTLIGRLTTFATSIVLVVIACKTLLSTSWPTPSSIEWSVQFLYLLLGVNIFYLVRWGVYWKELKD
jgi:phosphatidylglycerophosphate synthase